MGDELFFSCVTSFLNTHKYQPISAAILDFHLRVLEQAVDTRHPLIERLNFLLIFPNNSGFLHLFTFHLIFYFL